MSPVSAYRLLSDSEEQLLSGKILAVCRSWLADWCPYCPDVQLLSADERLVHRTAPEWLLWVQDSATWVGLRLPKGGERSLAQLLFAKAVMPAGELTPVLRELLREVLEDLLCRLKNLEAPSPSPETPVVRMTDSQVGLGAGAAVYVGKLAGGGPHIEIALGGAITARLLPTVEFPAPATPVVFRDQAISNGRVRVEAVVGEASFSLGELASLAPGDVIALDIPIDHPIVLRVPGRAPVCHAHLGTLDDHKAVQLLRISQL